MNTQQEIMLPMKYRMFFISVFMFLILVGAATAGDISGKWIATAENADIEMIFKVDGTTLKGTLNNPLQGEKKILGGKIDGDNISFYVIRKDGQVETRILWKGLVDGDVIRFNRVIAGLGSRQIIALRPKAASPGQTK
jgi:hypothetical protein